MLRKIRLLIILGIVTLGIIGFILYLPKILGDVFYPLPPKEQLEVMRAASQEFNVPLTLIVAVAKHESGFRADALSPANARGIMQIVPGTGAGLARELNLLNYTVQSLSDPGINIRLGTYYLSRLLTKYKGDVRSTLAHYNAGPRGPDLLGDSNREAKIHRGVEGYARRVIATTAAYEQLYGKNLDQGLAGPVVAEQKSFIEQLKDIKNLLPLILK